MANSAIPVFDHVKYLDPWGVQPPGAGTGVVVTVSNDEDAPSNSQLVARLLEQGKPVAYGHGGAPETVAVAPPGPLAPGLPYQVQVQWVPLGTDPSEAEWLPGLPTAPVMTGTVAVTGGSFDGTTLALSWAPGDAGPPSHGVAQVFQVESGDAVVLMGEGGSGAWTLDPESKPDPGKTYVVYLGGAALIDLTDDSAWTNGPLSAPLPLPTTGPAIGSVAYDGETLAVSWTAPAEPEAPAVAASSFELVVLDGGAPVAFFPADRSGGTATASLAGLGEGLTVAGRVSYGLIRGPLGAAAPVLPAAPAITAAAMSVSKTAGSTDVAVSLTAPALPEGAAVTVRLLEDGSPVATAAASGTPLAATLTYALVQGKRYAVDAAAAIPAGKGTPAVSGPSAAALALVVGTAENVAASYDGERLSVAWTALDDPALTGWRVEAEGVAQETFVSGPEPILSIPARLVPGDAATLKVTPLAGPVTGVAADALAYIVPAPAAPAVVDAAVDGAELWLAWSPSAGPWVEGYQVALSGGLSGDKTYRTFSTGLETTLRCPLPPLEDGGGWSVQVAAVARGVAGSPSDPFILFPSLPVVTGVAVKNGAASVSWAIVPATEQAMQMMAAAAAHVEVQLLDDDNVVATEAVAITANASTGTTAVPLPSVATGRLTAAVQLSAAGQTGARSGAAAVLTGAPVPTFGALMDGVLTLSWSAPADAGVTGYAIRYGDTGATVQGTQAALNLPAGASGDAVTLRAVGAGSSGPAASLAVVAPYEIASGRYFQGQVLVTLTGGGTPAPETTWVDLVVDGAVAGRAIVAGAPEGEITIPTVVPYGTSAVVRASGVGAASIAPAGAAVRLVTRPPGAVSAVYDGTSLHVAWNPWPVPGVSGYVVTVAGADPALDPVWVEGTWSGSAVFPATFAGAFPGAAKVSVAAAGSLPGGGWLTGPGSMPVAPTLSGSVRSVAASATGRPPYVYRRGAYSTLAASAGKPVTVYLESPFVLAEGKPGPTVPDASAESTFTLAPVSAPVDGGPAYQLTLSAGVWSGFDGSAARAALRTEYREFLKQVEAANVTPWGIALVRQAIAAALPQTFAETLYYRYGLWQDAGTRVVDLDPGLRLRVSGAAYQSPSGSAQDERNGYVVVGAETYDLAQVFPAGTLQAGLAPALTVDAFLSQLFPGAAGSAAPVAAGPLDFFGLGARQQYFRVLYPASFMSSATIGSNLIKNNVAILGAPSWTALENATDTFCDTGYFPTGQALFTAFFRGRAALTPLLALTVDGESRWVPAGTTLRQVLATLGAAPTFGTGAGGEVTLTRAAANVFDHPQGGSVLRAEAVDLSGADLGGLVPQLWPLDVPVLGGDAVVVTPSAG